MASKDKKDEGAQFVRYFGPLLDALRSLGGSAKADEAVDQVAQDLKVSDDVLDETLPSGGSRFRNQVAWARFYLVREGLIDSSKHGVWSLTEKGFKSSLTQGQSRNLFLKWVEIFQEQRKQKDQNEPVAERVAEGTGAVSKDYRERHLMYCSACLQQVSSDCHSAYCVKQGSRRSQSPGRAATAVSTALAFFRSIRWFLSKCCSSASGTQSQLSPRKYVTFEL